MANSPKVPEKRKKPEDLTYSEALGIAFNGDFPPKNFKLGTAPFSENEAQKNLNDCIKKYFSNEQQEIL